MNNLDTTPTIAISKCINFCKCRYNGDRDNNEFINKLKDYVTFIPFCPEVEIGMEIPRKPIRLVEVNNIIHLVQPATQTDLTDRMLEYTNMIISKLQNADGFIMKTRSPSCGIKEVKIYDSDKRGANSRKGKGMVGGRITEVYSHLPIEDDGRLRNFKIREHFLTKLYLMSTFRKIKSTESKESLIEFHRSNALLMMAYNQSKLKELNKSMNDIDSIPVDQLMNDYEKMLGLIFRTAPRYTSNISVLLKCVDYFKKDIKDNELGFILELINEYKNHKVPFSAPLNVIKGYVIRFNIEYLKDQSFFDPFPKALMDVNDSGKGVK